MYEFTKPCHQHRLQEKKRLGNRYPDGRCYTQAPIKVYDHDYTYLAQGNVIPHGIYDLQANEAGPPVRLYIAG